MAKGKTGPLSYEDKEYIKISAGHFNVNDIAEKLRRPRRTIIEFCEKNNLVYYYAPPKNTHESQESIELRNKLRKKTYYFDITQQLDPTEISYFEDRWIEIMQQFNSDVLSTEELEIKQLIVLDILMGRSMKERRKHIADIDRLEKVLTGLYSQNEIDGDKIAMLEEQIANARNSVGHYDTQHTKLLEKSSKLTENLKATREQRIKIIEESKKDWVKLLKYLDNDEIRAREGKQMELMKLLADKTKEEYYQYHEFADKTITSPILCPESIEYNEKLDNDTKKKEKEMETA